MIRDWIQFSAILSLLVPWVGRGQTTRVLVPGQPALVEVSAPRTAPPPQIYEQRQYGGAWAPLVTSQQAAVVIDKFKKMYDSLGRPRLLISINRELLEPMAPGSTTNAVSETAQLTLTPGRLADFQTRREVERLFGRPLRLASAELVDFGAVEESETVSPPQSVAERRNRMATLADVVMEVLISARPSPPPRWLGDPPVSVPDVQVTAIRLKDSRILGQASSSDLLGKGGRAAQLTREYGTPAIVEATALALMEDMAKGKL